MLDPAVAQLPSRDVHDTSHTSGVMTVENAQPMQFRVGLLKIFRTAAIRPKRSEWQQGAQIDL
jgi:hypothetical protein